MKRTSLIWGVVLLIAGIWLLHRAMTVGNGAMYVRGIAVEPKNSTARWTKYENVTPKERHNAGVELSWPRTLGVWLAGLLSLAVFSFLWRDNPAFKLMQSLVVGVSAGLTVATAFWTQIVPNLLAKLWPGIMRSWATPQLEATATTEWLYVVPLVLSGLLLCRLLPRGGWISRWPLAFFIGVTAGLKLVVYFRADFVEQIRGTIIPLVVVHENGIDWFRSFKNLLLVGGVLSCLTYFFFSVEHRGPVRRISRVGICVLMITFGASFGYTVMGRISLLAARLQFLLDDWLWLIDPFSRR